MFVDNLALKWGSGPLVPEVCGLLGLKFLEFSHGPYCGIINRVMSPSAAAEWASLPDSCFSFSFLLSQLGWGWGHKEKSLLSGWRGQVGEITLKEARKYCQCRIFCLRKNFSLSSE